VRVRVRARARVCVNIYIHTSKYTALINRRKSSYSLYFVQ